MDKDQIMMLMATVKKQHDNVETMKLYVERLIKEQREHEDQLMRRIQAETRSIVESQVTEAVKPLTAPVQRVINTFEAIKWQPHVYLTLAAVILIGGLMSLFLWWLPDYRTIEQGRADAKKYQLDYSTCGNEPCVRVIRKKCGFGPQGDYCVVDPK